MALHCGLIGLPLCGKTTIFNAITAAGAASYDGAEMNRAMVNIPDQRLEVLASIYKPKKVVPNTIEVVDIPGLKAGSTAAEGHGLKLLGHIKDADALLHVVRCFEDEKIPFEYATADPVRDTETIELELMVADSQTLRRKIERLTKKILAHDTEAIRDVSNCRKVNAALEQGIPARRQVLSTAELASIYDCHLVSLKPVLYIANVETAEDIGSSRVDQLKTIADADGSEMIAVCGRDEAEIWELEPAERPEFLAELGFKESSIERLLHAAYRLLGLVGFFTGSQEAVHAWTCRKGDKAPVAAGKIHTDMGKGFIRMEVFHYDDLVELGSEAAVSKAGKMSVEGRNYEVQDGDIAYFLFKV
jgi:GTP-binding protein YchF